MKIGFDGKRAVSNNTGLGNYSRLLLEKLSDLYPENAYIIYAPEWADNKRLSTLMSRPNVEFVLPDSSIGRAFGSLWRSKLITKQIVADGIELFHGLSGELPIDIKRANIPTVVTVHDLIFLRHPEYYKAADRKIYDLKFRHACDVATRIIAISERTKSDIIEYYGTPEEKIDVVYQGCDPQFCVTPSMTEISRVKEKYGLTRPYVISVGTIEERKNQIMAVRGIRGLTDDLDLVLVGRRTSYDKEIQNYVKTYHMGERVKYIENADFADLPALYAGAFCSSYTSRYEGFGIPVIESLSVGTPVIVASGSCLEEAGGPGVPSVDPDDVEDWVNCVRQMQDFPQIRKNLVSAGRKYVQKFSNDRFVAEVMKTYGKAVAEFNAAKK